MVLFAAGLKTRLLLAVLLLGWPASLLAADNCRIAILGDSLTAGFGVALEQAFPVRLEQALRERGFACDVLNAGVSGDTSAGGLARLEWVLADQPTHLIVELGGNDALRGLPPAQLEANLDAIVEGARRAGVQVFIAGMLAPLNLGEAYGRAFAEAYRAVADRHDVPLYPFFLDGVVFESSLMQADGIHPNAAGVAEILSRILPSLVAWLEETGLEREG